MKIEFSGYVYQQAKVFWISPDNPNKKMVGIVVDVSDNPKYKNLYKVSTFDTKLFDDLRPLKVGEPVYVSAYLNGKEKPYQAKDGSRKAFFNLELKLRTIDKTTSAPQQQQTQQHPPQNWQQQVANTPPVSSWPDTPAQTQNLPDDLPF